MVGIQLNIDNLLKKYYYNTREPSSFQSVDKLFKVIKKIKSDVKLDDVSKWLLKQQTYTVHKPIKLHFKRNPIVSKSIDHNWHADLVEISHPKENNNFKYILMVIDNLSKYGWAEAIKNKKGQIVKRAFINIIKESKRKPKILTTDAGSEFTNHNFKRFLKRTKLNILLLRTTLKPQLLKDGIVRLKKKFKNI